jgi:hypothetical protein
MPRRANQSQSSTQFTQNELDALRQAGARGWLTLTPEIGDTILTLWQRECERFAQPFAVIRVEPDRATLWFVLAPGREWDDVEQRRINAALAGAKGFVVTPNHARVFSEPGTAVVLMRELLSASAR